MNLMMESESSVLPSTLESKDESPTYGDQVALSPIVAVRNLQ